MHTPLHQAVLTGRIEDMMRILDLISLKSKTHQLLNEALELAHQIHDKSLITLLIKTGAHNT